MNEHAPGEAVLDRARCRFSARRASPALALRMRRSRYRWVALPGIRARVTTMRCSAAFGRLPRRQPCRTCGPLDASRGATPQKRRSWPPAQSAGGPPSARSRAAVIAWQPAAGRGPVCATRAVSSCVRSASRRWACARRARAIGISAGSASTRCAPAGCPSAPPHSPPPRSPAGSPAADSSAACAPAPGHRARPPAPQHRGPARPAPPEPGSRCSARAAANASCPSLLSRRPLRRRSRAVTHPGVHRLML